MPYSLRLDQTPMKNLSGVPTGCGLLWPTLLASCSAIPNSCAGIQSALAKDVLDVLAGVPPRHLANMLLADSSLGPCSCEHPHVLQAGQPLGVSLGGLGKRDGVSAHFPPSKSATIASICVRSSAWRATICAISALSSAISIFSVVSSCSTYELTAML